MINNLWEVRKRLGIAQWGLAALARVSATTVSAIERWGYQPSKEVRERIAEALGVPIGSIWPDDADQDDSGQQGD